MKYFIKRVVYFLLPILVILYPLDYFISEKIKKSNEYPGEFEVMNDIYAGKINCDLAVYGSSRAWVQISPVILENITGWKTYNFGIDGHNFWLQYLRHIEYIKFNSTPKKIIVSVDFVTLQKRKDLYYSEQFLPYMLWNTDIYKYTNSYFGFDKIDYFIPLVRYIGKRKQLEFAFKDTYKTIKKKSKYRFRGYAGQDKKWNDDFDNAKLNNKKIKVIIDIKTLELFEKFIKECNSLKIDVILVYAPEYIEGQNFISNRDDIVDVFKKIEKDNKIPFLDYSKDSISYNKNNFYNSTHLNKKGAELFSNKLAEDLKTLKFYKYE
jgi:hypothetical protein